MSVHLFAHIVRARSHAVLLLGLVLTACLQPYGGGTVPSAARRPAATPVPAPAAASRDADEEANALDDDADADDQSGEPVTPRTIAVRVLADERVRSDAAWRDRTRAALARAAAFFQPVALRFEVVDYARWDVSEDALSSMSKLLDRLEQQPKGAADIVLGLVGGEQAAAGAGGTDEAPADGKTPDRAREPNEKITEKIDELGSASFLSGDAIVARWSNPDRLSSVIAHQGAHLLGAIHVQAAGSIMRDVVDTQARRIDGTNRRILALTRNRSFDRNRPPLTLEETSLVLRAVEEVLRRDRGNRSAEDARTDLLELARLLEAHQQEGADDTERDAARLLGAARAERSRGQHGRALAYVREAARLCPRCKGVHLELAKDLLERHRLAEAIAELRKEIQRYPKNADAHFTLGVALAEGGQEAEARAAWEATLGIDPGHAGAKQKLDR